jgi:hypothetical protein
LIVLSILNSTFLFVLNNTVVADVHPVIIAHFNSVGKLTWLGIAFLIGAGSTNLVWGKIYRCLVLMLYKASLVEMR